VIRRAICQGAKTGVRIRRSKTGTCWRPSCYGAQPRPAKYRTKAEEAPLSGLKKGLKSLASSLAVIMVLTIYTARCYGDLVNPYTWDKASRVQANKTGWEVAVENRAGDLVLPWTWFWPPAFSLAFVRPGSLYRASSSSDTVFATVLWVRREENGSVVESLELQAFDCKQQQFSLVADLTEMADGASLYALTKRPLPGPWTGMSSQISNYFCGSRKS
jgi:hypothetical protein